MLQKIKTYAVQNAKNIALVAVVSLVVLVSMWLVYGFWTSIVSAFSWVASIFGYDRIKTKIRKAEKESEDDRRRLSTTADQVESQLKKEEKSADRISDHLGRPADTASQDQQDVLQMLEGIDKGKL